MSRKTPLIVACMTGAFWLTGCDQSSSEPATDAVEQAESSEGSLLDNAGEALQNAEDTVTEGLEQVEDLVDTAELQEQAQGLMDQITQKLGASEFTEASSLLDQLKALQGQLPESLQESLSIDSFIEQAQQLIDANGAVGNLGEGLGL